MLRRVTVENYALIDSIEIEFCTGLNIVTGETGAGKSLLLGALSLILGGKADLSVLRNKDKNCVIEAEFDIKGLGLEELFDRLDLDPSDSAVIRRVINPAGKSRGYINDLPVNLSAMKEVGDKLIDIHSQHQTLLIGDSRFQMSLIDSVANNSSLVEEYSKLYGDIKTQSKQLNALREAESETRKDEDYLKFQYAQLGEASLKEGEQEELELLLNELSHASEIKEALLGSDEVLTRDDSGVLSGLREVEQSLRKTEEVFPKSAELNERIRSIILDLKDISSEMAIEGDRVDVDPQRLEATEARLDMLYSLLQKHRVSDIRELIELRDSIEEKLQSMANFEMEIAALEKAIDETTVKARKAAGKISESRRKAIPVAERYVVDTMTSLGIPNIKFKVELTPGGELLSDGTDKLRFLFSANKNAPLQPLEQVASGGEMSRLMLALKSLVARHKQLPAIIFDEIDSGISGNIADRMGQIIHDLSSHLQVINITHLPQVASKGDNHYYVFKEDCDNITNTRVKKLSDSERVMEIAQMLSGSDVTSAATEQALFLLNKK